MITAESVKTLRERTGAGMMDCKKALIEVNGDMEAAVDWLKVKGLAAAAKKNDRIAAEGLVGVIIEDNKGAIVEVNSETDFVARNEHFQNLIKEILSKALVSNDLVSLKTAEISSDKTINDKIIENIATIGENLSLRRVNTIEVSQGIVASYIHNATTPSLGKIGVIIGLESAADKEYLQNFGKQIAMHIAAAKPQSLDKENLDSKLIQRERDIFTEQARNSGKPDNIIEKMIDGRIRKYYEEVVLLEQIFVIDGTSKISDLIEAEAKELGCAIKINSFYRYEVGEGISLVNKNFADEVASIAN